MPTVKPALLALSAAILAGCAAQPPAGSFAISDLKYGTICGSPGPEICTQTADIALDGKEHCTFNHEVLPCNWYGFSFDYVPKMDGIKIDCDTATDYKTDFGNPEGVIEKEAVGRGYQAQLSGGHFVNPQYTGYFPFEGVHHLTESCSYEGRKLFEFTLNLRYVSAAK
jgi:hypothetical protein